MYEFCVAFAVVVSAMLASLVCFAVSARYDVGGVYGKMFPDNTEVSSARRSLDEPAFPFSLGPLRPPPSTETRVPFHGADWFQLLD